MSKYKNILVTGGAGFIGSHFIKYFLKNYSNFRVINLDKLTYSGNLANLADIKNDKHLLSRYVFVKGDIADPTKIESIFKKYKPEYLVNFAAETHVDRSIHVGAKEFIDTNVCGVFVLLEAIKKFGLEKAVFVSTDEVYGSLSSDSKSKFTEKTQYQPNVPYSATKAGGDLLCRAYHFTWKLPIIVTHCSNNYGEFQYPEKLIPFFTLRAIQNKFLPLYGDGENVRDWIYVLDHVRGLEAALLKGVSGQVYNFGADNELPNIKIARMILKYLGKSDNLLTFVADRPGHDRYYAIDSSKAQKELSWKPINSFTKMLPQTIQWYLNNKKWVQQVQRKTGVINAHIDLWKSHKIK